MRRLALFGTPLRATFMVTIALVTMLNPTAPASAGQQTAAGEDQLLRLTAFSPSLLGMYRKVMEIDSEIKRFTDQYELTMAQAYWQAAIQDNQPTGMHAPTSYSPRPEFLGDNSSYSY